VEIMWWSGSDSMLYTFMFISGYVLHQQLHTAKCTSVRQTGYPDYTYMTNPSTSWQIWSTSMKFTVCTYSTSVYANLSSIVIMASCIPGKWDRLLAPWAFRAASPSVAPSSSFRGGSHTSPTAYKTMVSF
jgi:hypothetical protein